MTTRGVFMEPEIIENEFILLKPATKEDLELILTWRSHPEVYRYFSMQDGPLQWEEYIRFWIGYNIRFL